MGWYRVTMDSKQIANLEQVRLMHEFTELLLALAPQPGGIQKEMVVFTSFFPEDEGDDDLYRHYFSPGCLPEAKALIERYGGEPCEQPSNENLAILVGFHQDDPWKLVGGYKPAWR